MKTLELLNVLKNFGIFYVHYILTAVCYSQSWSKPSNSDTYLAQVCATKAATYSSTRMLYIGCAFTVILALVTTIQRALHDVASRNPLHFLWSSFVFKNVVRPYFRFHPVYEMIS